MQNESIKTIACISCGKHSDYTCRMCYKALCFRCGINYDLYEKIYYRTCNSCLIKQNYEYCAICDFWYLNGSAVKCQICESKHQVVEYKIKCFWEKCKSTEVWWVCKHHDIKVIELWYNNITCSECNQRFRGIKAHSSICYSCNNIICHKCQPFSIYFLCYKCQEQINDLFRNILCNNVADIISDFAKL